MSALQKLRTKARLWLAAALLGTGLASGALLGITMTAGASTPTSSSTAATAPRSSNGSSSGSSIPASVPAYQGLPKSGTVTAVGSDRVTIDGASYAVTTTTDVDKNGESTLSALAVGDKVTFSTVTSASTPTIDKLHAGNESLDKPSGTPPAGSQTGSPPPSAGANG